MPSPARILVPMDFSPPSEGAAQYAHLLARHLGCQLTLLHVMEPFAFAASPIEVPAERLNELMAGRARVAQADMGRWGAATDKRLLVTGTPAEQILLCAKSERADLIVIPTHGFDPIRRFLLGSVASKVLYGAEIPVLTGVHFEQYATAPFPPRHVVCGLDLGPNSGRVLAWAAHLAEAFGAPLTVVYAASGLEDGAADADRRLVLENRVREHIATLPQPLPGKPDVVVAAGDPHKALRGTVERLHADLLVIGRGGGAGGPFGRLRAHAYAIVRAAPCPVLSV